jgi:hypothetical protein
MSFLIGTEEEDKEEEEEEEEEGAATKGEIRRFGNRF